jgi:hypothetical protein
MADSNSFDSVSPNVSSVYPDKAIEMLMGGGSNATCPGVADDDEEEEWEDDDEELDEE